MRPGIGSARLAWVAAGLVLAALLLWLGLPGKTKPSVILISIDSLRPDHLGCYGYGRETSPRLDSLAAEGALFEAATSSTCWTLPAHAALFTGLPDSVHGCKDTNSWLAASRETLAERFQAAGYKTVGFFSGPLLHPHFGFGQGFDTYHDCTSFSRESIALLKGAPGPKSVQELSHEDVTNAAVLAEVERWLEAHPSGPRFLFIHLWDVHYDYIPQPPYDRMFDPDYAGTWDGRNISRLAVGPRPAEMTDRDLEHLKALYDGEIRWTDDTLKQLMELFERRGLRGQTLLAIAADHGEAFYEHGALGHTHSLHEVELRIPLILHFPGVIPAGLRVEHQAHITDIAPTLLALAGLEPFAHALGRDLSPLLLPGRAEWPERQVVGELFDAALGLKSAALRAQTWKLIRDYIPQRERVFDLKADPGEQAPLENERLPLPAARIGALQRASLQALQEAARRLPMPAKRDTPAIPAMTEKQLRALGYLK